MSVIHVNIKNYFITVIISIIIFVEKKKEANHVLLNEYLPGQGIMPHLGFVSQ